MIFVASILLTLAVLYGLILTRVGFHLRRLLSQHPRGEAITLPDDIPVVSVIIPARNEEDTIIPCLERVLANDYPAEHFEVLVVDDDSTDATADRVRSFARRSQLAAAGMPAETAGTAEQVQLLQRTHDGASGHKSGALAHGLSTAQGDIILTTDADCRVGPRWIRSMVACFDDDVDVVAGPVRYRTEADFFSRIQALEFMGLIALGAGSLAAGTPNICNSANLAYRRKAREAFDLLPAATGAAADELLLQHVAYETDRSVRFCARPEATVETNPVPTVKAFLDQRQRWASMPTKYLRPSIKLTVASLYSFHLIFLLSLPAAFFFPSLWMALLVAFILKMGAEALLLVPALQHFDQKHLLSYFLPAQLLHVPYVVYVGLAGSLGEVRWKDRSLSK